MALLIFNHGRTSCKLDIGQLTQRYLRSIHDRNKHAAESFRIIAQLARVSQIDRVTLPPFNSVGDAFSSDRRFNQHSDVADHDTVAGYRVAEVYFERRGGRSIVGNIYKGVVDNVLPGLEAAFVDIGLEKNGFLHVDEIVLPGVEAPKRGRGGGSGRKISDLLKPGQEVVVRIRDRGHVNRTLRGLVLEGGDVPPAGAEVVLDDAAIGKVTSAAWSVGLERPIALAFLRRQHAEPGTRVSVRYDGHVAAASVSALPFTR